MSEFCLLTHLEEKLAAVVLILCIATKSSHEQQGYSWALFRAGPAVSTLRLDADGVHRVQRLEGAGQRDTALPATWWSL